MPRRKAPDVGPRRSGAQGRRKPGEMTDILIHRSLTDDPALAAAWDALGARQPRFFPSYAETKAYFDETGFDHRVLVAKDGPHVVAIACLLNRRSKKDYMLGERRLFALSVREAVLYGEAVLGDPDQHTIAALLRRGIAEWPFDLVRLGEIAIGSPLHAAASHLQGGLIASRAARKDSIRHLIQLPASFDDFVKALGSVTRNSTTRKLKKFERDHRFEFEVVSRTEQIDRFLREGEAISRHTYQWHIGQRLCDDEPTRRHFVRLAEAGRLRCYMLRVDGRAIAFLRGELSGPLYHYETPGYEPEFQKASPGTVILMWTIRDLIEHTDCRVFDFGTGGDDSGYKSHYSNIAIRCVPLELGRLDRPYSLLLVGLQAGLSLAKNMVSAGIGSGALRQRLKRLIRQ
jgi:hypothetical protein